MPTPSQDNEQLQQLSHEEASLVHQLSSLPPSELAEIVAPLPEIDREAVKAALSCMKGAAGTLAAKLMEPVLSSKPLERTRCPREDERRQVRLSRVAVFTKISKFALDMHCRGLSEDELLKEYERELTPERVSEIRSSHFAHCFGVEELKKIVPAAEFHVLHTMEPAEVQRIVQEADLCIALGGDDTLKQLARFVTDQFVLAANSDPSRSAGVILPYRVDEIGEVLPRLQRGEFLVEEWQRLEAVIQQKGKEPILTPPALSEIGIFDEKGKFTFRGVWHNGKKVSVKGTGVHVTTGVGSTGWYSSAARAIYPLGRKLARTQPVAEYIVREYYGDLRPRNEIQGVMMPGEEFYIVSSSNNTPILNCDYSCDIPFPAGAKALIRFSNMPLKVVSHAHRG